MRRLGWLAILMVLGCHAAAVHADNGVSLVTSDPWRESNPAISPDGNHIAFVSHRGRSPELNIMALSGKDRRPISTAWGIGERIAWSPDGKSVSVIIRMPDGPVFTKIDMESGEQTAIVEIQRDLILPALSPDGKFLAYSHEPAGDDGDNSTGPNLQILDIESGTVTEVAPSPYRDLWPSWHPDGKRLVFFSRRDTAGKSDELYLLELESGTLTRLTRTEGNDFVPAFSPDGARIAFASSRDGSASIYIMNADGSCPTRITPPETHEGHPTWSPDGTRIYFSTRAPDANYDIAWVNAPLELDCK